MQISRYKGITGSDLKYIAILAMLIDHIAWLFVPLDNPLAQIMHTIGRITAPVMCYFITEGYHYTSSFRKYLTRMCIFAVISHFAFSYFNTGSFISGSLSSIITTLTLCLIAVWVVNNPKLANGYKFVLILLSMYLAEKCDCGANAVIFTLAFELARGDKKLQMIAYAASALICRILPIFTLLTTSKDLFWNQIYNIGLLLPIPLLMMYNGKRGGGKATKWVFYIFYPAHLLLLGYIAYKYI